MVGFLAGPGPGPGPGPRPALASVADIELKGRPVSRQEEHIAALSPRQNTSHFFFLTSSVNGEGSVVCSFCFPVHSLRCVACLLCTGVLSTREIPRRGEPDRRGCPQTPHHGIRERKIKQRHNTNLAQWSYKGLVENS